MLFGEPEGDWDGRWTVVQFHFQTGDRTHRDHMRSTLMLEGFGCLGPGVYIHPRDRVERVLRALGADGQGRLDGVSVFRGPCVGGRSDADLVKRVWDVKVMNDRYRSFLRSVRPLQQRIAKTCSREKAFFYRIGVVLSSLMSGGPTPRYPRAFYRKTGSGSKREGLRGSLRESLASHPVPRRRSDGAATRCRSGSA